MNGGPRRSAGEELRRWPAFDHRRPPALYRRRLRARRAWSRLRRREAPVGGDRPHFRFEIGERRFGYVDINKNGCTTLRRVVRSLSPFAADRSGSDFEFLRRYHALEARDLAAGVELILVYRDPVRRFVSMFQNKMVSRTDNEDLLAFVRDVLRADPDALSLRGFAERLAEVRRRPLARLFGVPEDGHVMAQRQALGALRYRHAVPLEELSEFLGVLLGSDTDERVVRARNASPSGARGRLQADVPSGELHEEFRRLGTVPGHEEFLDEALESLLRSIYVWDHRMIEEIGR